MSREAWRRGQYQTNEPVHEQLKRTRCSKKMVLNLEATVSMSPYVSPSLPETNDQTLLESRL
jgi:hypothetical protein